MSAVLEKIAYDFGRKAYINGEPNDLLIPEKLFENADPKEKAVLVEFWLDGWNDESVMQALPDGSPA